MSDMKNGYSERVLGNSCVVERLHSGFCRVITEDGREDLLRAVHQLYVGDVGRTVYYSDGMSYGLTRFDKDPSVEFDFEKAKRNYPYGWKDEWPGGREEKVRYAVYGYHFSDGSKFYLGEKNARRCTLPSNYPREMRALFDSGEEALAKVRELDGISQFGSVRHYVDEVKAQELSLTEKIAEAKERSEAHPDNKESINLDEYEYVSNVDGYSTFRKIVPDGNGGTKGIWAARHQDGGEPFEISYAQARGFEPIDNSPIKQLSRQLGEMLLP